MKNYPLEIESYAEGNGYWSKGHHDKQEFAERLKQEQGLEINPAAVTHEWYRKRPALPHEEEYAWYMESANKGGRGAFPVTEVWI